MKLFVVLGLLGWGGIARLIRGEILSLREREFAEAARRGGGRLVDLRWVPDDLPVGTGRTLGVDGHVVLTVGTDCNVGNVGCIMGLVAGLSGIHGAQTDWVSDVNDHVLASLILGSECVLDIPTAALRVSNLGRAVNGIQEQRTFKEGSKYHFSFPGSTHCWEFERTPGQAAKGARSPLAVA